jgi:hypothetical protein
MRDVSVKLEKLCLKLGILIASFNTHQVNIKQIAQSHTLRQNIKQRLKNVQRRMKRTHG